MQMQCSSIRSPESTKFVPFKTLILLRQPQRKELSFTTFLAFLLVPQLMSMKVRNLTWMKQYKFGVCRRQLPIRIYQLPLLNQEACCCTICAQSSTFLKMKTLLLGREARYQPCASEKMLSLLQWVLLGDMWLHTTFVTELLRRSLNIISIGQFSHFLHTAKIICRANTTCRACSVQAVRSMKCAK